MALEASHIRFALDLKDRLDVSDIDAYVSGSIYPDSRYVTDVDREATHPKEYRDDPVFMTGDFHKGWYVHLLCDDIQQAVMKARLPQTSEGTGQESWLKRSAIKILQDIDDAKRFDLARYIPCLEHIENPNGEDIGKMREYQDIFPDMYADPAAVTIDIAADMWRKFGIGDELAEEMADIARRYAVDTSIMASVRDLYGEMLSKALAPSSTQ